MHSQQLYFWEHYRTNRLRGNAPAAAAPKSETEAQSGGFTGEQSAGRPNSS